MSTPAPSDVAARKPLSLVATARTRPEQVFFCCGPPWTAHPHYEPSIIVAHSADAAASSYAAHWKVPAQIVRSLADFEALRRHLDEQRNRSGPDTRAYAVVHCGHGQAAQVRTVLARDRTLAEASVTHEHPGHKILASHSDAELDMVIALLRDAIDPN